MSLKYGPIERAHAEDVAIGALVFLSADDDRLRRFLDLTGLDPATVREAARDGAFLASVLDHILQDESLLLLFCEMRGLDPASIGAAHTALAGPPPMD